MYHYIRDMAVPFAIVEGNIGYGELSFAIYHFLRTAGWTWVYECDGDRDGSHCLDASMEASGTSDWTAIGTAALAKTTATKHQRSKSLSVKSNVANDGVQSAALPDLTAADSYRLKLWAYNSTGQAWEVQADGGSGSFSTIGTIPSDGAWTLYEFVIPYDAGGSRYFKILDVNNSQGTIYLDSIMVFYTYFEGRVRGEDLSGSPDGQILNGNEFHSASFDFSTEVDHWLAIWDPTNLGNSGMYRISGATGTDAVLDLRAGGSPALVSQTGLRWRVVDPAVAPTVGRTIGGVTAREKSSGWGLESPHSSKWRLFARTTRHDSLHNSYISVESCPFDGDFDVERWGFAASAASSKNLAPTQFEREDSTNCGTLLAADTYQTNLDGTFIRLYLVTDDDCSFLTIMMRHGDGGNVNVGGSIICGHTGADTYHTLRESFVHFARTAVGEYYNPSWANDNGGRMNFNGMMLVPEGISMSFAPAKWMCLGIGSGAEDLKSDYTNARPNPFDSQRRIWRPKIARDYFGRYSLPSEKDMVVGLWDGLMDVADWTAVDSNTMLHMISGVFLELPSSGGVGLFPPLS